MMNRPTENNTTVTSTTTSSSTASTTTPTTNDPVRVGYQHEDRITNDYNIIGVVSRTSSINLISSVSSSSSSSFSPTQARSSSFNSHESAGQPTRISDDRTTPIPTTTEIASTSMVQDHHPVLPNNNNKKHLFSSTNVRSHPKHCGPMIVEPTPPPRRTQIIVPTMSFGNAPPISSTSSPKSSSTSSSLAAKVPSKASSSVPAESPFLSKAFPTVPISSHVTTKDPTTSSQQQQASSSQQLPPRPLSAYNLFFRMERKYLLHQLDTRQVATIDGIPTKIYAMDEVAQFALEQRRYDPEHPEAESQQKRKHCKTHGKISFTNLARHVASRWKTMSDEQRRIFQRCYRYEMDYYRTVVATQVVNVSANSSSTSQGPPPPKDELDENLNASCSSGFDDISSSLLVPGSSSITTHRNDNPATNTKIGLANTTTTTPMSDKKMTIITPSIEKQMMTNVVTGSSTKIPKHVMTMSRATANNKLLPMIEPFVGSTNVYAPKQPGQMKPYRPTQVPPKSMLALPVPKGQSQRTTGMSKNSASLAGYNSANATCGAVPGTAGVASLDFASSSSSSYCGNCGCYYCDGTSCGKSDHQFNPSPMIAPPVPRLPLSAKPFHQPRCPPKKNFCNMNPNNNSNNWMIGPFPRGPAAGFVYRGCTPTSSILTGNPTGTDVDDSFTSLDYDSGDFISTNTGLDTNQITNKSLLPWNNGMSRSFKLPPQLNSVTCSTTAGPDGRFNNNLLLNNDSCITTKKCHGRCNCNNGGGNFIQGHSSSLPGVSSSSVGLCSSNNRTDGDNEEYDDDEEKKLYEYRVYLQQRRQKWRNRIQQLHKKIQYQQYQLQQFYNNYSQQQQAQQQHFHTEQQQLQDPIEPKYYEHRYNNNIINNSDMNDDGIGLNDDSEMTMMMMENEDSMMMDPSNFIDPFE